MGCQRPRQGLRDLPAGHRLALALRQGAKVYINENVLERASFPYLFKRPYDEEQIVEDFKSFLDGISPDDFA